MSDITLLYSGYDTIYVAIMGALSRDVLDMLKTAKEAAIATQEPQLVSFGSEGFEAHLHESGMRGGYAFRLERGPTDIVWAVKNNAHTNEWNLFAMAGSACLLAHGYEGFKAMLFADLDAMGAKHLKHSINRVDYAMDFQVTDFTLNPFHVVAHSHCKVSNQEGEPDDISRKYVTRGRKTESITIGKLPGRQIILYDKRREIIERRKFYWAKQWGVDLSDRSFDIIRVELRAGGVHLKEHWRLFTFKDLEDSIGDVFIMATEKVRYLKHPKAEGESNVTEQELHLLWQAVQARVQTYLAVNFSGLCPSDIREYIREEKIAHSEQMLLAYSANLAVALGMDDTEIMDKAGEMASGAVERGIRKNRDDIMGRLEENRRKMRFIVVNPK